MGLGSLSGKPGVRLTVWMLAALAGIGLAMTDIAISTAGEDRLALWYLIHNLCVPNQQHVHAPTPCVSVDLSHGVEAGSAVLKDRVGATQYLLIPTRRVTGIESPLLLEPGSPNYWNAAWAARTDMVRGSRHPLPRDVVGLAINAIAGRSQDQLHIHVDCVRRDVRDKLRRQLPAIGKTWAPLSVRLLGEHYEAMRVEGDDLAGVDPFKLLGAQVAAQKGDMGRETLAVIGTTFEPGKPGFILLAAHVDEAEAAFGHSEELLDHACELLKARPT